MVFHKLSIILIVFLQLIFSSAYATAADDFKAGLTVFKQKQYEQAIEHFELARRQGMKTPALYYNLAVSYFKTGNFTQAKIWFIKSRQYKKIKYLSEYNLGLVAIKQNDRKTAIGHFNNVAKNAQTENLVKLANYQLVQLNKKSPKAWSAFAQLKYGHDDNVTTAIDGAASKQASSFVDIYANGSFTLLGNAKQGLILNTYVFDTRYRSVGQYDMQVKNLGLGQSFTLGKSKNTLGIDYQTTTLAGKDYQQATIYEARTRYTLSPESELRLRYRFYTIDSQAPYAELSGNKQRLRLEYRRYPGQDKLKLYYEYETNDRSETATTTSNYSPSRYTLRGNYTYALSDRLELTGDLAYRLSQYPRGATSPARDETRTKTSLELDYYLNKIWFLSAEYSHTNNDSTNLAYRYVQNVSAVSINAFF